MRLRPSATGVGGQAAGRPERASAGVGLPADCPAATAPLSEVARGPFSKIAVLGDPHSGDSTSPRCALLLNGHACQRRVRRSPDPSLHHLVQAGSASWREDDRGRPKRVCRQGRWSASARPLQVNTRRIASVGGAIAPAHECARSTPTPNAFGRGGAGVGAAAPPGATPAATATLMTPSNIEQPHRSVHDPPSMTSRSATAAARIYLGNPVHTCVTRSTV